MSNTSRINQPTTRSLSLGKFLRSRGRYLHTAARVALLPDPANPMGPRVIPWTERPGRTYNIGRNAAKRAAKAQAR